MRKTIAPKPPSFASLVQQFFTEYLVAQRAVSPRTVACYRDALMLFLDFSSQRLKKAPTSLKLNDIQPELILAFLDHLEHERHNAVRSRNLRLTALRAFLKFAGRRDVASLHVVERALAVPMKRFERPMLGYLTREEMLAVLGQPGDTWTSQRDHLLLALLYNTGARVSEIIGVQVADVVLDGGACVQLHGKGRKQRSVPLWHTTVAEVRAWLRLNSGLRGAAALLPNRDGQSMTRSNVVQRLELAVTRAATQVPGILNKRVSPHVLRHTTAMHLLQSGVPFNVIALWLGHESPTTTHRYVEADLAMKEKALARLDAPDTTLRRFKAPDSLMRFLQTL
ncbi:tyrosine-type recombinase/integrase [Accumulibacter sp.]|uniref:tyrosine-type recombinase/integrase n=1 Tax=Accumulibacter sp. TaxID=2053492 RepID=UPI001D80B2C7|nr:tyrosine-type recombinase/integrase [Accumulibacter sp.]MCB1966279.1 site-specific integrase [Accumulibacter sp.]MCP5229593.1 site-specific integrase [Accumulibacter sp.]